jgi:exonuclease 3'-5' domain-containing protein 1
LYQVFRKLSSVTWNWTTKKSSTVFTQRKRSGNTEKNIFSIRPLDTKTLDYYTNDVRYLPALRDTYMKRIKPMWLDRAVKESARRMQEAQSTSYNPNGSQKAFGPWGWRMNEETQDREME